VVVCLTGTDLYGEGGKDLESSMREADYLVVLQERALERIPPEFRPKTRVLVQGVEHRDGGADGVGSREGCSVCVVGHLREVKDPMRAAEAVHGVPEDSALRVVHAGAILEEGFRERVEQEMAINPRYRWVGELSSEETRDLIAGSEMLVLSSRSEGGARVVGEAVVEGVPVLSTRIDGVVGLLGEDYAGYFEVGDTEALAGLMIRVEEDEGFRERLRRQLAARAPLFDPGKERDAWEALLRELDSP
jgi:glycosyltransferase involved in cell wall biosynthesis